MIECVSETGSTNADLLARLEAGEQISEGTWLVAERQNAGRGRQGRAWFDGYGNFMGSTVVHLAKGETAPQSLALVASLALYDAVLSLLPEPQSLQLKWPNDVLLKGAKLSGILMERVRDTIVLGVGVNLAQAPELPDRATIAIAAAAPPPTPQAFAKTLAHHLTEELQRWRSYGAEPITRRWLAAAHPEGTPLKVHDGDGVGLSGTFAGLTEDASLRLRLADGTTRVIHAGDVMLSE